MSDLGEDGWGRFFVCCYGDDRNSLVNPQKQPYNDFVGKDRPMNKNINLGLFIAGLTIAFGAAVLLVMNVIESGVAAMIGIVGIGLIAASGRSNIKKLH